MTATKVTNRCSGVKRFLGSQGTEVAVVELFEHCFWNKADKRSAKGSSEVQSYLRGISLPKGCMASKVLKTMLRGMTH